MSTKGGLRHLLTWRVLPPLGAAVLVALLALAPTPVVGQSRPAAAAFPAYHAPRLDGHPDLNGIWQAFVTANVDLQDHEAGPGPHPEIMGAYGAEPPGQSIVEGG